MSSGIIRRVAATAVAFISVSLAGTAGAVSIQFFAYNAAAPELSLSVDVLAENGLASFEFANNSSGDSAGATLARIYFESGFSTIGLSNGQVMGGVGTQFGASYPGPGSPPAGNNIGWAGEFAAFGAAASPSHNGVGVGDSLLIEFAYSGSLADLVAAITDPSGNARIAGHVLDCVGGNSCAATAQVVPLPAGLPLLLSGIAGLALLRKRALV